jgi:stage II sporulation protein D
VPASPGAGRVTVHDVTIGKGFHWQRTQSQEFEGELQLQSDLQGLAVVNELPLEAYLTSVISSEMSASCPSALLEAHAIVSRSWLLAQPRGGTPAVAAASPPVAPSAEVEIVRWYDRESHANFDVCADDHCQRYQGATRAFSPAVFEAVRTTAGRVLVFEGEVCDARYSKCCGGMTEVFPTAWAERDVRYLQSVYDGPDTPRGFDLGLQDEAAAERWIRGQPEAYCRRSDPVFLAAVLPGFDQETRDFFRWEILYSREELEEIVHARVSRELGRLISLQPLERGPSGRIRRLRIVGEERSLVIGKELEIRRALARTHLLSSAFLVQPEDVHDGLPARFRLIGAGWGHGVGLCQIGAASMAERGASHETILGHYFRGSELGRLY